MTLLAILLLVSLLAFANGANDNCKGVATLVGFGAARPRQALAFATLTTAAGALLSFWLAGGLIKSFSTGLFAAGTPLAASFFVAVLAGAFGWVILATVTGMPVSTTHAIVGGLVGAGLVAWGADPIRWGDLGKRFALPLVLSPLLSTTLVYGIAWPVLRITRAYRDRCACVIDEPIAPATPQPAFAGAAATTATASLPTVVTGTVGQCAARSPRAVVTAASIGTALHWTSSGLVGFARGWNDAPKIAALCFGTLVAADVAHAMPIAFALVTVAMAVGGVTTGRKVLETLSKKVTPLPLAESLTASLVTASLVSCASWFALPVSTTHVSTGAIVGAGLRNDPRAVRWAKVGEIVLSWVVTLPAAGILAALTMWAVG